MKIGIIIPCYNDENKIEVNIFVDFIKKHQDIHLCFVNGGSKDNTLFILNRLKNHNKEKISVVDIKKNKGKAFTYRVGLRYLSNINNEEFVDFVEVDLSEGFTCFERKITLILENNKLFVP